MTIPPFHEPVMLKMPLEGYAERPLSAESGLSAKSSLNNMEARMYSCQIQPTSTYRESGGAAIAAPSEFDEARRLCMFFMDFLALPYNGAQEAFRQLLLTHTEMLNEASRIEWLRRLAKVESANVVTDSAMAVANQLLPKLLSSR